MMKKIWIILIFSTLGLEAGESPFEDFIIGVLPEYDYPGILVIYTGVVNEETLPITLEILVPQNTLMAAGVGQVDTSNILNPIGLTEKNGEKWIITPLVKKEFEIQFHYNPFGDSRERKFDLPIELNQPLKEFYIVVQEPFVAGNSFQWSELDSENFQDEHGLTYHRVYVDELSSGELKTISVSYNNPAGKLSVEVLQEILGNKLPANLKGTQSATIGKQYQLPTYNPLVFLGLLGLVIGFIFWKSNYKKERKNKGGKVKVNFCTHCGNQVTPIHKYCTGCGHRLK